MAAQGIAHSVAHGQPRVTGVRRWPEEVAGAVSCGSGAVVFAVVVTRRVRPPVVDALTVDHLLDQSGLVVVDAATVRLPVGAPCKGRTQ